MRGITIIGQYWQKSIFVMSENASFQGCFTEVSFDTSEGNQLIKYHIFKMAIFQKLFWRFHEQNAGKKILLNSDLFTIKNYDYRIVTFSPAQSLFSM